MKVCAAACAILLVLRMSAAGAQLPGQANEFRQLTKIEALPVELDRDFEFRKTKLYSLGTPGPRKTSFVPSGRSNNPSVAAEDAYRLFGAVTELDKRRRYGHYFDFFWRA